MTTDDERRARRCHPAFGRGPSRPAVIVQREERQYPARVRVVQGGDHDGPEVPLTVGALDDAFENAKEVVIPDAAFLAGRSETGVDDDIARFVSQLQAVLDLRPPEDLRSHAASYVEAAMSLALLGDVDSGRAALEPLVAGDGHSTRAYLAAAYLAQLGDPSGWPVMLAALGDKSEHTRLMATRNLLSFVAYDAATVASKKVDVTAQLLERLDDDSLYVAREVPGLMMETGMADVASILHSIVESGRPEAVRQAAGRALDAEP